MAHPEKTFTLEEAHRALPLIQRITQDLTGVIETLGGISGGIALIYRAVEISDLPPHQQAAARELLDQIDTLVGELLEIGVELKGLQPVLVDFPSERDGGPVYLCWRYGEPRVGYWHTIAGGFRERQPL